MSGDHHANSASARTELAFAILAGVFLVISWGSARWTDVPFWIPLTGYALSYGFGGWFALIEMSDSLRRGKFDIDLLMLVAAGGAAALGAWAEGALLLFLFSLGHALEHFAMGRARRAIEALGKLAPEVARVRRDGREVEVPVDELEVGDIAIVRPNERMPADGFIVRGESAVDQASVTGESVPVDKYPVSDAALAASDPDRVSNAHRVYAGTINGLGALEVQVTRRSSESMLARVVQLVNEAESQQSPTQRFAERFERVFVPIILGFTVLLLFAWVVIDEPFSASFYRAMAVVVAASPCALAIATPSAVLSAVARAGRGGVLVKGGGPLENLGALTAIAFDKTGTLTEGRHRVTDVIPVGDISPDELLATAAAVERLSDHPLARAVEARASGLEIPSATDLQSITGLGVQAHVSGQRVLIGKDDLFGRSDAETPPLPETLRATVVGLETSGRTTMIVLRGDTFLGVLGLMDTPRASARDTLSRLREMGIQRMIMISGDNQVVAEAVGQEVGLDEVYGDLMPDDKVTSIQSMVKDQMVAMVGDGVNDAPAMANATVGIAMGAAGSDVALETADVALMADNLSRLPFAVGLSRATRRIIRQNVWISLGMVAVLIPSTLAGLDIGPAVALHEGSTLVVVLNALRLLGYADS